MFLLQFFEVLKFLENLYEKFSWWSFLYIIIYRSFRFFCKFCLAFENIYLAEPFSDKYFCRRQPNLAEKKHLPISSCRNNWLDVIRYVIRDAFKKTILKILFQYTFDTAILEKKVVDKWTKLSKMHFWTECFTVDLLRDFAKSIKIWLLVCWLSTCY